MRTARILTLVAILSCTSATLAKAGKRLVWIPIRDLPAVPDDLHVDFVEPLTGWRCRLAYAPVFTVERESDGTYVAWLGGWIKLRKHHPLGFTIYDDTNFQPFGKIRVSSDGKIQHEINKSLKYRGTTVAGVQTKMGASLREGRVWIKQEVVFARQRAQLYSITARFPPIRDDGNGGHQHALSKWVYRTPEGCGRFEEQAQGRWVEVTAGGRRWYFQQRARTSSYVELYDASRGCAIRLHRNTCYINYRSGAWRPLYSGHWER
jgi:hypothetical protein